MIFTYSSPTTKTVTLADASDRIFFDPRFPSQCVWDVGGDCVRVRYVGRGVVVFTPYRGRVQRTWRTWRSK